MDLIQLRCFLAVAEELHFGRAARRLDMLPASLGRHMKNFEEGLGTALVSRTTRHVALTEAGLDLLEHARQIVVAADAFEERARTTHRGQSNHLRIGAIDSAAIGLLPQLLQFFREDRPDIDVSLHEQKTIRLLPRLMSGRLDLAFVRPPDRLGSALTFRTLINESTVVAIPSDHPLAGRDEVRIEELAEEPLIVPDRRSRPHSHDLTIKMFLDAGLTARIGQIAEEKHTIVNMVSAGLGLAIVPRWSTRLAIHGVKYIPLKPRDGAPDRKLVLSAAWVKNTRDSNRDALMNCLERNIDSISETA